MRIGIIISLLICTSLQCFGVIFDTESLDDSLNDDGGIICIVAMDDDDENLFVLDLHELAGFDTLFIRVIQKESAKCFYYTWIDPECLDQFSTFISSDTSPPKFRA